MRLIDKDALIKQAQSDGAYDYVSAHEVADAAEIDAVPVVRGEWLNFVGDYTTAECSVCGECYDPSDHKDKEHFDMFKQFYKFCPNCGAKMEDKP